MSLKLLDYTSKHCIVETWVKNCTARFYNQHRDEKLPSKEQLQIQSTETSFCICLWSNNQVLSKFYCLYFPLALIRWKSSHCHLREPFKSKESWKKKFDSNNNCKTAWSRMIVKWHLIWILSLGFVWKMLSFWKERSKNIIQLQKYF